MVALRRSVDAALLTSGCNGRRITRSRRRNLLTCSSRGADARSLTVRLRIVRLNCLPAVPPRGSERGRAVASYLMNRRALEVPPRENGGCLPSFASRRPPKAVRVQMVRGLAVERLLKA